ncbi:PREDICTED: uncharacterized protein LOC106303113 [Brassica oleracea var. oleracea]|uniref:uncharacterized protein LOC106303113 n=1 Tax=Brassica oleracea var. oleracea TaxID=109376 RepID=UPI0006A6D546|nr:PREDICTED: uncharacterized protein LOC106303113 [Brassica oleracea var. oleracea]
MSFEDAYHKYRVGNFFRESRETDKDIELLFNKVSCKPKRTLKKEQDPGKFLIPCSIHIHHLPNVLCDTGSAVSIMAIDIAELLGLKMEPSKDSFTFVDSSRVNSAGMIKNVKVEIGECITPVDFHAMDIKAGKTSPLLFGRAFMATVGAVCDFKRNKMCLANVDETIFYDPMEREKSEELISCIEMFEDPGSTADSNREPAIPESASVDIRTSASFDFQSSESIDNKPSESDDFHSSESIDTKTSASVDTLRLSEQLETEKSKSGGWTRNRKKKKEKECRCRYPVTSPFAMSRGKS